MMKSIATAVAGLMFIMGVTLVGSVKEINAKTTGRSVHTHLRPSADMLKDN